MRLWRNGILRRLKIFRLVHAGSSPVSRTNQQGNIMKPGKTFKLYGPYKTMIALMPFKDKEQRGAFKNMMIQAQLAGEVRPAREKSDRK